MDSVKLRAYRETDKDFVFSSWLKSFKSSWYKGPIPAKIYWPTYQAVLEYILAKPSVKVTVACNPEDEDQIFGYLVAEDVPGRVAVHYCYVKQPFRRLGVATALLSRLSSRKFSYTFKTPNYSYIASKECVFNPKLVDQGSYGNQDSKDDLAPRRIPDLPVKQDHGGGTLQN